MDETPLPTQSELESSDSALQQRPDEALQELRRHGYEVDRAPPAEFRGRLLRHPFAPDLLLRDDGLIEVPVGQPAKAAAPAGAVGQERRIFWGRGVLFVVGLALATFLSFLVVVNLLLAT